MSGYWRPRSFTIHLQPFWKIARAAKKWKKSLIFVQKTLVAKKKLKKLARTMVTQGLSFIYIWIIMHFSACGNGLPLGQYWEMFSLGPRRSAHRFCRCTQQLVQECGNTVVTPPPTYDRRMLLGPHVFLGLLIVRPRIVADNFVPTLMLCLSLLLQDDQDTNLHWLWL